jgi:hypothetical protein
MEATAKSSILYCTVQGSISVVMMLSERDFVLLAHLQTIMRLHYPHMGVFDHADYRSFKNSVMTHADQAFIDGDYVQKYLGLSRNEKQQLLVESDSAIVTDSVLANEQIEQLLENLARLSR